MKYADYKAVYIDKTATLKNWTKARESSKIVSNTKNVVTGFSSNATASVVGAIIPSVDKLFEKLSEHWAENYGVEISKDVKELNFLSVRTALAGIEAVAESFPEAFKFLKKIDVDFTLGAKVVMGTEFDGTIKINPDYFNRWIILKNKAEADALSGFHPKNTGIAGYGAHEAGHILERYLIEKANGGKFDWNNGVSARKIIRQAFDNIRRITPEKTILSLYSNPKT